VNAEKCSLAVACVSLSLAVSGAAHAQDVASAEALFRAGRDLMEKGDYDAGCPKLAESNRLDPSSGTALNLALCHAKQGKTATAWAEYLVAARLARQQQRSERVEEATKKAEELERGLSHLTIVVEAPVANLDLRRDEARVEPSSFGISLPIDPGRHVITVQATGYKPVTLEVLVGATRDDRTLAIPPLVKEVAPPRLGGGGAMATERPSRPPSWAWGVGATGLAATLGGIGLLIGGGVDLGDANSACAVLAHGCASVSPSPTSLLVAGGVVTTVGLIGLGVGIYGLVKAPRASAQASRQVPELRVAKDRLLLEGHF
jgi:hypothetical protein